MTLEADPTKIEWLFERIYMAKRDLEACNVINPTFVILTKGIDDRRRVEASLFMYFRERYGGVMEMTKHIQPDSETPRCTLFQLPEINARMVLMDL